MKSVFEFTTYKEYLRFLITESSSTRGLLSRLSDAAECQRSYLSKVLQVNSKVHLLQDHVFGISQYLNLSDGESEYLMLLLEKDRASQSKYKKNLEKKMADQQNQHLNLKNQINKKQLFIDDLSIDSASYYSFWLYSALHIATSILKLQTTSELSKRFSVPEKIIIEHLLILQKLNLVRLEKNRWLWNSGDIHLSKDSASILPHHMNWRQQAIQDVVCKKPDSVHYSLVQSLSESDYKKLQILITGWIKSFQNIAGPSKSEEIVCFNLDFFKIGNQ